MESAVNPQPTDAHIRISHEFHRELIRRKFTQRQRNIIDFILTLSWGCGKSSAIIPMLKHFELCGIRKEHIRKELLLLVEKHIILWDQNMNIFQINKHYDLWKVENVERFDIQTMNELITLNIESKTPNLAKKVTKKVTQLPKKQPVRVTKKVTQLHKRQLVSYQKSNSPVTKKVTLIRDFPRNGGLHEPSKTIFKAIIKKRTTTTTTRARAPDEFSFGNIFDAYERNFIGGGKITQFDIDEFSILFDDYGGEWLLKAMREAYRQGQDKRNLAYVHGVLKGYRNRGGPDTSGEKPAVETTKAADAVRKTKQQQSIDDLRRRAREERQLEESRGN